MAWEGEGGRGGLMVSALDSRLSSPARALCCVLGLNTLLSQCLSSPRCIVPANRPFYSCVLRYQAFEWK